MELVVLVITGIVVYYVVIGVAGWWGGYRERHNAPLQVAAVDGGRARGRLGLPVGDGRTRR